MILLGLCMPVVFVLAERCRDDFFEPNTFQMLNSVSGASTIAKIDYWEQTDEMDAHAAYILNMSEVSASYCWSQGHKVWSFSICQNVYRPRAT